MTRLLLVFLILLGSTGAESGAGEWPQIRSHEARAGFERSVERFELIVPIYDVAGSPVYWILCIGGSDDHLDRLSAIGETNLVEPTCMPPEHGESSEWCNAATRGRDWRRPLALARTIPYG